jgi:uncharacterized membrane protein SirB2
MYFAFKLLHLSTVTFSLTFFAIRGAWMLLDMPILQKRWVRILPQVIDSILLTSAIGLTLTIHQYPFVNDWLTAKILALMLYILLGTFALRRGRTKQIRSIAFCSALLVMGYILWVARTHTPIPWAA